MHECIGCRRTSIPPLGCRAIALGALILTGLSLFCGTTAFAQFDLVITRISVRPLSASTVIRGAARYAAQFNVTVANGGSIVDRTLTDARPVTVHLMIARVLPWTSRLSYSPVPIYTCDYVRVLDCSSYGSYVEDGEGIRQGTSKTYPIPVQITGHPRDWADPRRGLEGSADITGFSIFDVDVDRSRLRAICKGRVYCYSIVGVVNRNNPAGEVRAARGNNTFIGQVLLPPQRLHPLGP